MLQTNILNDPIVEILRLAYRRGLAIQQEKERNENSNPSPSQNSELVNQTQTSTTESMADVNLINE